MCNIVDTLRLKINLNLLVIIPNPCSKGTHLQSENVFTFSLTLKLQYDIKNFANKAFNKKSRKRKNIKIK